jgi:hypothetical protein
MSDLTHREICTTTGYHLIQMLMDSFLKNEFLMAAILSQELFLGYFINWLQSKKRILFI